MGHNEDAKLVDRWQNAENANLDKQREMKQQVWRFPERAGSLFFAAFASDIKDILMIIVHDVNITASCRFTFVQPRSPPPPYPGRPLPLPRIVFHGYWIHRSTLRNGATAVNKRRWKMARPLLLRIRRSRGHPLLLRIRPSGVQSCTAGLRAVAPWSLHSSLHTYISWLQHMSNLPAVDVSVLIVSVLG